MGSSKLCARSSSPCPALSAASPRAVVEPELLGRSRLCTWRSVSIDVAEQLTLAANEHDPPPALHARGELAGVELNPLTARQPRHAHGAHLQHCRETNHHAGTPQVAPPTPWSPSCVPSSPICDRTVTTGAPPSSRRSGHPRTRAHQHTSPPGRRGARCPGASGHAICFFRS